MCREKVAIVACDAPFLVSKAISAANGSCSGLGAGTSDFRQVGTHVEFERICN